jgi:F-type H+-transporting ATPase subunit gamma
MAQLIQMQQRIKAVKTIKKTTHAMRLIAMSNHTKLKNQQAVLTKYTAMLNATFATIRACAPTWYNATACPIVFKGAHDLIVLVGSQKTLCGNFNNATQRFFEIQVPASRRHLYTYVALGKTAGDYLERTVPPSLILARYNNVSVSQIDRVATALVTMLFTHVNAFSSVTVFHNKAKTFFAQKPEKTALIPFCPVEHTSIGSQRQVQDYHWEQQPHELLDMLVRQCLQVKVETILFESLLAEQSARFISMDNATRNAETLLKATLLQYNKVRQAKITRELAELSGNF